MAPVAPAPEPEPVAAGVDAAAADRYRIDGMDCAACARTVQKAVAALDGVRAAEVSFGNATLLVEGAAGEDAVRSVVARAGYRATPAGARREPAGPWDCRSVSTVAAIVVLVAAVVLDLAGAGRVVVEPAYLLSMAVGGWPIAWAAALALRRRSLDMNVLMALAAAGAVGIGSYAEGAWVLVLFAVGTTLEAVAFERSRRSVRDLLDLAPPTALVDGEHAVPVDEVTVGTRVLVRPGERIPLDGDVVDGRSSVDESPVTGESVPVDKGPGDAVFAGTLNAHGALTVATTRTAGDSTLARVAALVERAQGSTAPSERFVDRFAAAYTPVVFGVAVALAVVPPLLGGDLGTWVYRALALLIVACPCSLVISIPVAVVSAVGHAARDGVLVKGGQALEDLARVRTVALDKTGTLTRGTPTVAALVPLADQPEATLLALAAAVERSSEHPLARAIVRAARDRGLDVPAATAFEATPGLGVRATVDGRALWLGGPRDAAERLGAAAGVRAAAGGAAAAAAAATTGHSATTARDTWVAAAAALAERHAAGQTAVVLGEGDRALGVIGLADRPRREASAAVRALRAAGVERVVMLTGDHERVARAAAAAVGVDAFEAGLLPEDKLRAVERLHGPVAMVGDGINDTPALAAASVGVAMGAAGTDAALEAADVALMGDDLGRLPDAVLTARRAARVMRQNVVASLAVKAVFVALAPFGLVTLVVAVAADMGMSLLVTLNGLRLLRATSPTPAHDAPSSRSRQ